VLERPAAAPPLAAPLAPPLAPPKPLAPVGTPTPDPIRNGGAAPAPQVGAPSGAPGAAGQAADSLAQLAARWDHVVDFARAARPLVGSALASARPLSADAGGLVIIELQESNDTLAQTLEMARDDVLAAVRIALPGAARVIVRAPAVAAPPPERLTAEGIRADRLASLSRRDPVLGAAIEHLDLDLLD
jgi:hypothetical protein